MRISDCSSDVCSSDLRHRGLADDGELHALLLVGNDHELRHVRRGAGSGGNQDQWWTGHVQGVHAFELENIETMGNDDADAFKDRKSVVSGKSVSVRVDIGGSRSHKKNKNNRKE